MKEIIVPLDPVIVAWIAGALWLAIIAALALLGHRRRQREDQERREAIRQAEYAEPPPFIRPSHPTRIRIEKAVRGYYKDAGIHRGEDGEAEAGRVQ